MASLEEPTAVTNGLVNVGPGPDLELATELPSDNDRCRAVTDAVVMRHKRLAICPMILPLMLMRKLSGCS